MYVCPVCTSENRDNANFCRQCGSRRATPHPLNQEENEVCCPCCARRVRHIDRFCMACGEKLRQMPVPQTKLCLTCKSVLWEKAPFCTDCGEYVGVKSESNLIVSELSADDSTDSTPASEA